MRTPMHGVLGMTEMPRGTPLTDEQRGFLDTVHGSGVALLRIINDILDFSKVEAGRLELEEVDFVLADCIGSTVDLLRGRAAAKGLPIAVRIAEGVPPVFRGDSARLRQILTNLVGKAVKFSERGTIEVRVVRAADPGNVGVLRFEVSDEGIGVAPDAQAHIFDAFAQADGSTSRRHGGSGLGLAICRQLVHLMGWRIGVDSQPRPGSTFWFTVRLAAGGVEVPVAGTVAPSVLDARCRLPTAEIAGVRVLLAEDNPVNRQVALAMRRSRGLAAGTVANGREAVDATVRQCYDIVLMDCQMPEMDSFAATAEIRKRSRRGHCAGADRRAHRERDDRRSRGLPRRRDGRLLVETVHACAATGGACEVGGAAWSATGCVAAVGSAERNRTSAGGCIGPVECAARSPGES